MQALSVLLRRVHETDGYPTVWPSDVGRWLVSDNANEAWVADLNGSVVGHVSLSRPESRAATKVWITATQRPIKGLAAVTRLFAAPEARGTGVGPRLLQHAVDAAHRLDRWPVLDVRQDGRAGASHLYEAAGWRLVGSAPLRLAPEVVFPFGCWIGPPPPN